MTLILKPEEKEALDKQFYDFLSKCIAVAGYKPRAEYLYPIMRGVPFKDLEVAFDMAVMEHANRKANDNIHE
jgi:hypothetical protein